MKIRSLLKRSGWIGLLTAAFLAAPCIDSQAGWEQKEDRTWEYQRDQTGEPETPAWDAESACHQLENLFIEEGVYQDDKKETVVALVYEDDKYYTIGAGERVDLQFNCYYNFFQVDKKTGEAYSRYTKKRYWLDKGEAGLRAADAD